MHHGVARGAMGCLNGIHQNKQVRSCAVDEDLIRATADLMVSSGLKKAGYHYLVIDGVQSA